MDKVFEVNINGERALVQVSKNDRYSISFPIRKDKEGNECYEHIENDILGKEVFGEEVPGLRFTSTRMYDKNYRFTFWVLDDGTMIWKDSENRPYRSLGEEFDRKATPKNSSEKLAQSIDETFRLARDYDKIGMSAKTVGESRKESFNTALLLAGYQTPADVKNPLKSEKSYFSLRRLGRILENYRNLAYVHREVREDGTEYFLVDYDSIPSLHHCEESIEMMDKQRQDDKRVMEAHEEWVENVRSFPGAENFLLGMEDEMSQENPEGWEIYSKVVRKTADMILGLNFDLLNDDEKVDIQDLTALQGLELQDKISELIDSDEFGKACLLEDKYVMRECDRVSEMMQGAEQVAGTSTSLITILNGLYRQVQVSRDERSIAVNEYNKYRVASEGQKSYNPGAFYGEDSDEEEEVK